MQKTSNSVSSMHNEEVRAYLAGHRAQIAKLRRKNRFFRQEVNRLIAAQVAPGSQVLDIGCSDGQTLAALQPRIAVGVDPDEGAIEEARIASPEFSFQVAMLEDLDTSVDREFDYIIASGLLEHTYDIYHAMQKVALIAGDETRIIAVTYSRLWQPIFRIAERLGLKSSFPVQNWIPISELRNLAEQADLEVIKTTPGILAPIKIPLLSRWVNRWLAPLPLIRHLDFIHVSVLRRRPSMNPCESVSIVIPARNESGHISEILDRLPLLAPWQEVIFVEGNSTDDTWEKIEVECLRRGAAYHSGLKWIQQPGKGKGDAVRAGFAAASGELLIILDADISVPPEELSKFVDVIGSGYAEFANGSRLVYGMEGGAMRFLNLLGNRFFGALFSFLLGQPVRDTLCGTKVLKRDHYLRIAENRSRFGDFDPFGDFDLLFGAANLNLRIRDVPIHYKARTYGSTNISRFRHGAMLMKMSWVAARRIRFV